MRKTYLLIIFSLGFLFRVDAQVLFEKGQSGLAVSLSGQESHLENGYYGEILYSFKGALDLYGSYGGFTYDLDHLRDMGMTLDKAPKETALIVGAEYWLLRSDPGSDRNINFGLWAELEAESYTDAGYGYDGSIYEDTDGSSFSVGFDFTINFHAQNGWNMQPYLWLGNIWATERYIENGTDKTDKLYGSGAGLGVMIQKQFKNGSSLWLINELDVDDLDDTADLSFVTTLGYSLSFGKK